MSQDNPNPKPLPAMVWSMAWPAMLQSAVSGVQGLVDHVMVSRGVGHAGNAAIGVGWRVYALVLILTVALASGLAILVARATGAGDRQHADRLAGHTLLAAVLLAVFGFAPFGWWVTPRLLTLVQAAPEVRAEALVYLRILFAGSVGTVFFHVAGAALRATGNARTPMRLGLLMTGLNVALNAVLIPVFGLRGAAAGTVLAAGAVSVLTAAGLARGRWGLRLPPPRRLDLGIVGEVLHLGLPASANGLVVTAGNLVLLGFVGSLAQSAAAHAAFAVAATEIFAVVGWSAAGLSSATLAVTGQSLGGGRHRLAARAAGVGTMLGAAVVAPVALAFLGAPRALLGVFGLRDGTVLALGSDLLAWLAAACFLTVVAGSYSGALEGAADTRSPLIIAAVAQVVTLALCAVQQLGRELQPADVWLAIVAGHAVRCVLSTARFGQLRRRWA